MFETSFFNPATAGLAVEFERQMPKPFEVVQMARNEARDKAIRKQEREDEIRAENMAWLDEQREVGFESINQGFDEQFTKKANELVQKATEEYKKFTFDDEGIVRIPESVKSSNQKALNDIALQHKKAQKGIEALNEVLANIEDNDLLRESFAGQEQALKNELAEMAKKRSAEGQPWSRTEVMNVVEKYQTPGGMANIFLQESFGEVTSPTFRSKTLDGVAQRVVGEITTIAPTIKNDEGFTKFDNGLPVMALSPEDRYRFYSQPQNKKVLKKWMDDTKTEYSAYKTVGTNGEVKYDYDAAAAKALQEAYGSHIDEGKPTASSVNNYQNRLNARDFNGNTTKIKTFGGYVENDQLLDEYLFETEPEQISGFLQRQETKDGILMAKSQLPEVGEDDKNYELFKQAKEKVASKNISKPVYVQLSSEMKIQGAPLKVASLNNKNIYVYDMDDPESRLDFIQQMGSIDYNEKDNQKLNNAIRAYSQSGYKYFQSQRYYDTHNSGGNDRPNFTNPFGSRTSSNNSGASGWNIPEGGL